LRSWEEGHNKVTTSEGVSLRPMWRYQFEDSEITGL
jgi:hypothetical protein